MVLFDLDPTPVEDFPRTGRAAADEQEMCDLARLAIANTVRVVADKFGRSEETVRKMIDDPHESTGTRATNPWNAWLGIERAKEKAQAAEDGQEG